MADRSDAAACGGLREQIETWRYRADLAEKLHGNAELNRRERAELAGEARAYGMCANELESLLTGSGRGAREELGSHRCVAEAHGWTSPHEGWTPSVGAPCDCGKTRWGGRVTSSGAAMSENYHCACDFAYAGHHESGCAFYKGDQIDQLRAQLTQITAEREKGERVFQAVVYAFEGKDVPEDLRDHGMVRRALKFREAERAQLTDLREQMLAAREEPDFMSTAWKRIGGWADQLAVVLGAAQRARRARSVGRGGRVATRPQKDGAEGA